MTAMETLQGKVAVVTGGGGGIGRATALLLAARGARVTVTDVVKGAAQQVAAEIRGQGGEAAACDADVSREEDVQRIVQSTVEAFGGVDILVNNAAAVDAGTVSRDIDVCNMEASLWDHVMAVNLRGPMLTCKYAIPRMLERGGGAVVNMSSLAGLAADVVMPAYAASKSGVNGLTRSIATRYGKQGVRCNAVAPGLTLSQGAVSRIPPEFVQMNLDSTPRDRLSEPEDIARVAVFLASDDAAMINGHIVPVDGGFLVHLPTFADVCRQMPAGDTLIGKTG